MNIRHLTFRLLQVYVQVVREGSISAAARTLHLTQPTVSLQLKKLAKSVGEPLLETREGRLKPTAIGDELYLAASDVLTRFDDFQITLDEARGGSLGRISIGIVTTAKYVMPSILGAFYRHFPRVEVTLNIGNRAHILGRFERREDDLYVFSHPPTGEGVHAQPIIRNPLRVITPPGHWTASANRVTFAQLKQERFLMREPGSGTRLMFESWLSGNGLELAHTMQIESNEAIRLSVASGLGLAVVSEHILEQGRGALGLPEVAGFPLESNWYLVRRRDRRLSHAASTLLKFIAENLSECIQPELIVPGIAERTL